MVTNLYVLMTYLISLDKNIRSQNTVYRIIEKVLEKVEYCKEIIKKHFNLERIKGIMEKLINAINVINYALKKILKEEHVAVTGGSRGSTHQIWNVNFQQIKSIVLVFYNLRRYDGNLIT